MRMHVEDFNEVLQKVMLVLILMYTGYVDRGVLDFTMCSYHFLKSPRVRNFFIQVKMYDHLSCMVVWLYAVVFIE